MTAAAPIHVLRGDELKQEFDRSFAEARRPPAVQTVNLLTITVGGAPHVLRLADIAALHVDVEITAFPSPLPELLGVTGFRGAVFPVYDLGRLLGGARGPPPRWVVIAASAVHVAFAFDRFERYLRLDLAAITPMAAGTSTSRHVTHVVKADEAVRPVIDLPSVVTEIEARASSSLRNQER